MKTLADIKAEIAKLEKQAAAMKDEVAGVIGRIKEAIKVYGLSAEDLGFGATQKASAEPKASSKPVAATSERPSSSTTIGVPKYRDPATGSTWTGRGKPPKWIASAKDRAAFLIPTGGNGMAATPAGSATKSARRAGRGGRRRNDAGLGAKKRKTQSAPAVQIESGAASE